MNNRKTQLLLRLCLFFGCGFSCLGADPVQEGVLSWREAFREGGAVPLAGEWRFFWEDFLPPGEEADSAGLISVPGNWAGGGAYPPEGYGSYRLEIRGLEPGRIYALYIPEMLSSFRLFVDGRELASNGRTGPSREESRPQFLPGTAEFYSEDSRALLTIWISNYRYRKGGIWRDLYLGTPEKIKRMRQNRMLRDMFLTGILVFISLYHISLFFFRREETAQLYFGLICVVMALRTLSTGEQLLAYAFPRLPWELIRRLEFTPFSLHAVLTPLFVGALFPEEAKKRTLRLLAAAGLIPCGVFFLLPVRLSNHLIPAGELYMVGILLYSLFIILKALQRKRIGASLILWAMGLLFFAVLNDVLYSNHIISTFYMAQIGFILFILIQALMLSRRYAYSFRTIENLTHNLKEFNRSLSRFVPFQFLEHLKKESILEVRLGDQVQEEMTILFADIRSFTTLSEDMSPEENFRFLNSFLSNVVPVIRQQGGFVDKFMGDGIMALFPRSPDQALRAAVRLQQAVSAYNGNRDKAGYRAINLGIGLHTGGLMLGTIGEQDRMETTVISDTVNIASRMEETTKQFGAAIIISRRMHQVLEGPENFEFRSLGPVGIKGKRDELEILEVLDGLDASEKARRIHSKKAFEKGIALFRQGREGTAREIFHEILRKDPSDKGAAHYLKRCETAAPQGPEA